MSSNYHWYASIDRLRHSLRLFGVFSLPYCAVTIRPLSWILVPQVVVVVVQKPAAKSVGTYCIYGSFLESHTPDDEPKNDFNNGARRETGRRTIVYRNEH